MKVNFTLNSEELREVVASHIQKMLFEQFQVPEDVMAKLNIGVEFTMWHNDEECGLTGASIDVQSKEVKPDLYAQPKKDKPQKE